MPSHRQPSIQFETGICLLRRLPSADRGALTDCKAWQVIGRIGGDTPFMLQYSNTLTNWWCITQLGPALRNKILREFKASLRDTDPIPAHIRVHDLRATDDADLRDGHGAAADISMGFFRDVWRAIYLGETVADFIDLAVPYAQKDQAKELGARWDAEKKRWQVRRTADLTLFQKWLPQEAAA